MTAARNTLSIACALFWTALVYAITHNRGTAIATFVTTALMTWLVVAILQAPRDNPTW